MGVGELDPRGDVAVARPLGQHGHAVGAGLDEEDPRAGGSGRGDQQQVRSGPGRDQRLGAVQAPAAVVRLGRRLGVLRQCLAVLGHRRGEQPLARGRTWQPGVLLVLRSLLGDETARGAVRDERDRGDGPPHLDQHAAQLDQAEAGAAVVLGKGEAEQSGRPQLGPELGVEAIPSRLDLLHPLVGRAVLQDPGGQLGGLVLLGGERKVHEALPLRGRQSEADVADDVALDLVGAAAERHHQR
jgi:hypothetical protein